MRNVASPDQAQPARGSNTIVLVGGCGGMSARYREVAHERGLDLRHFEQRIPAGSRRTLGKVAAVMIMVGMVSHALRDQVRSLAPEGAPIVYLRTSSISALRTAVERIESEGSHAGSPRMALFDARS
jgi:hypothetical protein